MATTALVIYSGASLRALSIGGVRQMYRISRDENITCACFLRSTGLRHPSLSMSLGVPSALDHSLLVCTNTLGVFMENASIWKCSWKWFKTKTHTYRITVDATNQNENDDRKYRRRVRLLRVVFECFSVSSRNLVKTRARARENRTIFPSKGVLRRKFGPVGSYMRAQRYSGAFVFDITVYNFLF